MAGVGQNIALHVSPTAKNRTHWTCSSRFHWTPFSSSSSQNPQRKTQTALCHNSHLEFYSRYDKWRFAPSGSDVKVKAITTTTTTTIILSFVAVVAFSSSARIWGERSTVHSLPALFFFFFKLRLARAHYFHSLGQDQSTVAQPTETTVTECSLTSCVWARFLMVPTLCLDSVIVGLLRLRWVKDVCVFGCNLPPALLAE